jgi:eukaryotic-like serine/threonine-protein kinase
MSLPRAPREIADRYRLERILKSGPQATLLRAVDTEAGRPVAVKLLNPGSDPAGLGRFATFAAAVESIETPTIPAVGDWGFTTDGYAFLVLELIDGRSFAGLAGTSHRRITSLAAQALGGLEALAARGVAHGNLSPENLLVEISPGAAGQRLRFAGLGTACFRRAGVVDTSPGARFRAPEEVAGGPPSLSGDLFGLARSLAEVLGAEISDTQGPAPRVTLPFSFEIERTDALQNVLAACLRANPTDRPGSADEVRRALRLALGKGFEAEPAWTPPPRPQPKPQAQPQSGLAEPVEPIPPPEPLLSALDSESDTESLLDKTQPVEARPLPEPQPVLQPLATPSPMPAPASPLAARLEPPPAPSSPPLANAPLPLAPQPLGPAPGAPGAPGNEGEAPMGSVLPEIDFDALGPPAQLGNYTPAPAPIPSAVATAAAASPAAPPPQTGGPFRSAAVARKPTLKVPRWAWAAGGAALLLAGGLFAWRSLSNSQPPQLATSAAPIIPSEPAKEPAAVRLEAAKRALADGDYGRAHELVVSLDVADQTALGPEGCRQLQVLAETIPRIAAEQLPADLASGLETGSIELLRRILAAVPDLAALPNAGPAFAADLARAREIVRMFTEVEEASKAGRPAEVLERFAPLAVLLPVDSPAFGLRERAAKAIEREAEKHAENGEYPQAQADLSPLFKQWPNRAGLRQRAAGYQEAQSLEAGQKTFLDNVPRYLARRRPDEGLVELRKFAPTPHLRARFAESEKKLTDQLTRLDASPPVVEPSGGYDTRFFRGTVANVGFHVRDDFRIANVEIFAGRRRLKAEKIGLRYEVEIPPSIHRNEAIEIVAVATDFSGHEARASVRLTRVGTTERLVR